MVRETGSKTAGAIHLSHSQITEFLTCPRKYHLHRVLALPAAFMPSGLLFGVSMHAALALYNQRRLEGREAGFDELYGEFVNSWDAEQLPVFYKRGDDEAGLKGLAKGMLRSYLARPASSGEVVAVEEPFALGLTGELPQVEGRIDLIERTGDGGCVLTDYKTARSRRVPSPDQFVLYREAAARLGLADAERLRVRYVLLLKTASADVQVVEVPVGPADLERLISIYVSAWREIERGCSFPRTGWWCKGCQWKGYCEFGEVSAEA